MALLVRISNGDILIVSIFGHKMNIWYSEVYAQLFGLNTDGKIVRFFFHNLRSVPNY